MTVPLVLVVVFAAVALGLASFSLFVSWGARADARQAIDAVRALAASRGRKRVPEQPVEEREVDLGPPPDEEDRRQRNEGPQGRHRTPPTGALYSRLRASADAREASEPGEETTAIPVARPEGDLATVEHSAPTSTYRRPPPPLPPPGAIGREL